MLQRDKARDKEQQDCSQLRASCERIKEPFLILSHLVRRGDVEYLSDEKQKTNYEQGMEPVWC